MSSQGLSPELAKSSPEAEESPSPSAAASSTGVRGTRESLWKRSKRTLGTTQFAFLQGKVAASPKGGENDGDKSKVAPSKRREQVRRAQRTHRQRTEAYVKTLEDEVIRLRKSEAIAIRKNAELQAELDALKQSINNGNYNNNLSPTQSSNYPYSIDAQSQQLSHPSSTVTVNDPMALDMVGVKFYEDAAGNLALETDRNNFSQNTTLPQFRDSAFNALDVSGINLNSNGDDYGYAVPPPPPPKNKDRVVLVTDDYQTGIDFVLLLEKPCIPHIHPHRSISPDADTDTSPKSRFRLKSKSSSDSGPSTGHVLTASVSLLNAYSSSSSISSTNTYTNNNNPAQIQPGSTWTMTANDIERLLYLSSSLQLQGEITPVEAWNRLRLHPGFRSLSKEKFEELKGELKGLVACYGFGAAIDELTFHDTIDRKLYTGDVF